MPTGRRRFVIVLLCVLLLVAGYAGYVGVRVAVVGYCLEDELPFGLDGLAETRLETRPYVQDVTTTSAALLWWTPNSTEATLRYGIAPELTEARAIPATRRHEVVLTDLQAGTLYAYEATNDGDTPMTGTLRTAPDASATVTIGVFGDSGVGGADQAAVAGLLGSLSPDLLLHTGDVVYPRGGICDYQARFFAPYADTLASVPIYPAIGNHDLDSVDGEAFYDAFRPPFANDPSADDHTGAYYSFLYGPAHVVVLDGELFEGDDDGARSAAARQMGAMAATLQSVGDQPLWTIFVVHRPLWTSVAGQECSSVLLDELLEAIGFYLQGRNVLVLGGHVHAYERSTTAGITMVTTGGGGAGLHDVATGPSTFEAEIAAAASIHHAVRLTVSPTELVVEAIATDGTVFDRHSLRH